jgi:HEAT repeat protein
LCEELLAADADAPVRDLAARLLGTLPHDSGTVAALSVAARDDAAWNVRYQAVDALGRFGVDEAAVAAVRAAANDADARVAKRARALADR